jgi:hypothetical protein
MAFTGRATYDNDELIAEDVSNLVSTISPFETPLLDYLGDAASPATNVLHEWVEDSLSPGSLIHSSAIGSVLTNTAFRVNGTGNELQVGDILRMVPGNIIAGEELMQVVTVHGANSITVSRAFGGVGANSSAAGGTLELISNASLEGADVSGDIGMNRTRNFNFVQQFQKPIEVSDTQRAVNNLGGIDDEYAYQLEARTKEILRDLEKAVILGAAGGNSFGSATAYRSMKGIWRFITTNQNTTTAALDDSFLGDSLVKSAWDNGGDDVDVIIADAQWKRAIDGLIDTRIRVTTDEDTLRTEVTYYESSFGRQAILPPSRHMPYKSAMALASDRIEVVPLQGRSFQHQQLAKTGHATKGVVVGEYTVAVMNEAGHSRGVDTDA